LAVWHFFGTVLAVCSSDWHNSSCLELDGWLALLTASTFNRLGQYAGYPGNRAYCYAELAVSSLVVAVTIASTHFAYPRRDGYWPG